MDWELQRKGYGRPQEMDRKEEIGNKREGGVGREIRDAKGEKINEWGKVEF